MIEGCMIAGAMIGAAILGSLGRSTGGTPAEIRSLIMMGLIIGGLWGIAAALLFTYRGAFGI